MKKTIILLIFCSLILIEFCTAQSEDFNLLAQDDVPYKLEMKFYKSYKKAQNVRWYSAKGENTLYKAIYQTKKKTIAIVYTDKGIIRRQEFSDRKSKIPEEVEAYFQQNYRDYKLVRLSKVYVNAASEDVEFITYYELKVKKDEQELALQFNEDHDLFKDKNYIDTPTDL